MAEDLDIGHGVSIRWVDEDRAIVWKHPECRAWSYLYFHPHPRSTGHVLAAGGPDNLEQFTITGSLLCPGGCGKHGLITNGRWVPA